MAWEVGPQKVTVEVGDDSTEFDPEDVTPETLINVAKSHGLSKFMVSVNGDEISSPSDFPVIKGGETIVISAYDEWA